MPHTDNSKIWVIEKAIRMSYSNSINYTLCVTAACHRKIMSKTMHSCRGPEYCSWLLCNGGDVQWKIDMVLQIKRKSWMLSCLAFESKYFLDRFSIESFFKSLIIQKDLLNVYASFFYKEYEKILHYQGIH